MEIYQIQGGGQKIIQNEDCGIKTVFIEKVEVIEEFTDVDSFTNTMYSSSIETLIRWAYDWSYYKDLDFIIE